MNKSNRKCQTDQISKDHKIRGWNCTPDVPIKMPPLFTWPLRPKNIMIWIAQRWFGLAENAILIFVWMITWYWLQSSLQTTKTLDFDWIISPWLRNMILMTLVAGVLQWFFYQRKSQGLKLKNDGRELSQKGRQFSFGNQVKDNAFWPSVAALGFGHSTKF